ncbi:hypothetical protein K435DRAFT_928593 [Dendrothele bispora CBS 962.96]|uniref:Uncharacterized protein n=1 Tax=Dendrothele bispora (strain CBS 962.96) TaxID=1314807 RepID=A0A4S8L6G8_DENBC|nr:hypothetical protein K435DRAFT_928593 [Dendrothele bispora CBS 962.96]
MSHKPVDSQLQDQQTMPTQNAIESTSTSTTLSTAFMHGASRFVFDGLDTQTVKTSAYELGSSHKPQGRDDFFKDATETLKRMQENSSEPQNQAASAPAETATVSFFSNARDFAGRDMKFRHVEENQFNFSENCNPSLALAIIREANRGKNPQDLNDSQAPQEEPETQSLLR